MQCSNKNYCFTFLFCCFITFSYLWTSSFLISHNLIIIHRHVFEIVALQFFCVSFVFSQCLVIFLLHIWRQHIAPWLQIAAWNYSEYFRSWIWPISIHSVISVLKDRYSKISWYEKIIYWLSQLLNISTGHVPSKRLVRKIGKQKKRIQLLQWKRYTKLIF